MGRQCMKFYVSELLGFIVKTDQGIVHIASFDNEDDEVYLSEWGCDVAVFEDKALATSIARRLKREGEASWTKIKPAMKVKKG